MPSPAGGSPGSSLVAVARSLATWRIRRNVLPTRTMPAAMAIAQPVVPFCVTCTSMSNGRPMGRPDSVINCAVTGTTPLALAVTAALPVKLSWAAISGALIVLILSRWRFSEVNTSRTLTAPAAGPEPSVSSVFRIVIGNSTPSCATV